MKILLAPGVGGSPAWALFSCRSTMALTSAAVTGVPSEYFWSAFSLMVTVLPSGEVVRVSTSSGFGTPFLSCR